MENVSHIPCSMNFPIAVAHLSRKFFDGWNTYFYKQFRLGPGDDRSACGNRADIFNALMAIPNLIGLIVLVGLVTAKKKDYVKRLKAGKFKKTSIQSNISPRTSSADILISSSIIYPHRGCITANWCDIPIDYNGLKKVGYCLQRKTLSAQRLADKKIFRRSSNYRAVGTS